MIKELATDVSIECPRILIVYIHGHRGSPDSLNYMDSHFNSYASVFLSYDSNDGFIPNLAEMVSLLADKKNIFFVTHSLGGLYALHLAGILGDKVLGAVTLAAPYGGSEAALAMDFISTLAMITPQQIYKDIHPAAAPITTGRNIVLHPSIKWVAIVTTKGHNQFMREANDGVLTISSMRDRRTKVGFITDRRGMTFVDVPSNHSEITQSREAVSIVKNTIEELLAA